jgi:hypothetical protein
MSKAIVTENKEKADAILKGTAIEKTSQELHSSSDATSVGAAAGGHESTWSGGTGSSNGGFIAKKMGIADAQASTETIKDARLAVRLVLNDGDVLWSTTQESKGAKYKSAGADGGQGCKQLLWDLEKLDKEAPSASAKN